jgi:hypothetical protein
MGLSILHDNTAPYANQVSPGHGGDATLISVSGYNITIQYETPVLSVPVVKDDVVLVQKKGFYTDFFVARVFSAISGPGFDGTSVTMQCGIDRNVYDLTIGAASEYNVTVYSQSVGHDLVTDFAGSHTISVAVESAVFSNRLTKYSSKVTYGSEIAALRRNFWPNSALIMEADNIYLIDDCFGTRGAAYKVSSENEEFQVINNKYRKGISFRIAV